MALHKYQKLLSSLLKWVGTESKRPLFYWLTVIWNRVDEDRIKEIGPDRACAEWLLRNGASVKWRGMDVYLSDYNALAALEDKHSRYIQSVDATDSSINHIGFPYFSGCKYIDEIKLINCIYIQNEALRCLPILKDTLKYLEIVDCANITDGALRSLKQLSNLQVLKLQGMPYVKDKTGVENDLTKALPNCTIQWK